MAADPWVLRCPDGHTSVTYRSKLDKSVCRACGLEWEGQPIDAREVDGFPVVGEVSD